MKNKNYTIALITLAFLSGLIFLRLFLCLRSNTFPNVDSSDSDIHDSISLAESNKLTEPGCGTYCSTKIYEVDREAVEASLKAKLEQDPKLENYPDFLNLVREKCLRINNYEYLDFNNDDNIELFVVTCSVGAVSCHPRNIYIYDEEGQLFNDYGFHLIFKDITTDGFTLSNGIILNGDPYCCPSKYRIRKYKFLLHKRLFINQTDEFILTAEEYGKGNTLSTEN